MSETSNIETLLAPLCEFLTKELKAELSRQGHAATGTLGESVRLAVRKTATGSVIEGFSEGYGRWVDTGRRSGTKKVPIDALLGWIRARGISAEGRKERDLAFAIQHSIFQHGIPTSGDKAKTAWITRTLSDKHQVIKSEIEKAVHDFYDIVLNNIIRDVKGSMT